MDYKLHWTKESIRNLEEILDYLICKWTQKEVDNFNRKLSKKLDMILQNPRMFPVSIFNPKLRKAVLTKQVTIFYEIKNKQIYVTYLFVNRKNLKATLTTI